MISQLTSQPVCLGDQLCTWHCPQRPSSRCSWPSKGDDIQGSASVLVVSLSWWTSWRRTQRRLPVLCSGIGWGTGLGQGEEQSPQVECRSGSSMWRKGGWTTGGPRVMQVSFILQPWRVPQKHFPLNQNFPNSLLLRLEYISVLMNWPAPKWWTEFHKAFQIPGNLCPLPPSYADCKITLLCEVICLLWVPAPTFPWFSA